ncbi:HoxN/HupN/NixA family nickel/cobalt transporter [Sphingomonas hengshuiensis]|uniref:Nickel/cobalt efflux system n=1 Tax=Sphingomonas hengshuiensis TaxID=1609977 RepID=A0A7U5BEC4_9SPHN|nr:nickel permease [Sphingomonas hengshuiensis]AJP70685.1 nickel permease [Sphingomonas hengshuiensis]
MIEISALWLMFVLGLRHGLDPDHVAVIDNIVFRTVQPRPRLALWVGTLFALGHSLSVAVVAIGVSLAADAFALPAWSGPLVDAAVIGLLLIVGSLNLHALLVRADYTPVGWRSGLVPRRLRNSTHPLAVVAIGAIFGLVFDTATQAAAWGAAATAKGGTTAALAIIAAFTIGMMLADTLDSQIVGRLLRATDRPTATVRRYRRAVGWLVVALSFGTAGYALAELSGLDVALSDGAFTAIGIGSAAAIVLLLVASRWRAHAGTSV